MKLALAFADPNVASFFTILRSKGAFGPGGWSDTKTEIKGRGNISLAGAKDLESAPEGDRITGAISVWTNQELFVTHADGENPGTSDIIVWRKQKYRLVTIIQYPERGYWKGICVLMSGN